MPGRRNRANFYNATLKQPSPELPQEVKGVLYRGELPKAKPAVKFRRGNGGGFGRQSALPLRGIGYGIFAALVVAGLFVVRRRKAS